MILTNYTDNEELMAWNERREFDDTFIGRIEDMTSIPTRLLNYLLEEIQGFEDGLNFYPKEESRRNYIKGGCICRHDKDKGWQFKENCGYHKLARAYPYDHSIAWNCPTYYDGCNCKETVRMYHEERKKTTDKES